MTEEEPMIKWLRESYYRTVRWLVTYQSELLASVALIVVCVLALTLVDRLVATGDHFCAPCDCEHAVHTEIGEDGL